MGQGGLGMNHTEVGTIKEINKLLGQVLQGKVENLPQAKEAKKLVEELIEFKDFDTWKLAQD